MSQQQDPHPKPRKRHQPLRRKKGSGGVEKVGPKWRARKQKAGCRPVYGSLRDSREEALADLTSLTFPEDAPDVATVPTLRDFMKQLLDSDRKDEVSYGTWKRDEIIWRTRVYPSDLGRMPIDKIEDVHCTRFVLSQRKLVEKLDESGRPVLVDDEGRRIARDEKGKPARKGGQKVYVQGEERLNRSGMKRIGASLSTVFERARGKAYGYIKSNPMHDVEYPRQKKEKPVRKALTPQQAAAIKNNLFVFLTRLRSQGDRFEAMVLTVRDTGMRRGEICALKRDALVKLPDGQYMLVVDSGLTRAEGGISDAATKSGNVREIPIGEDTAAALLRQPKRSNYYFTTDTGQPVRPDNFSRDFRRFRESIGMPHLKLHNLRHTYISLMLRAGVDLKAIQKLVGHAGPRMIMEVYGETFDESLRDAGKRFRSLLDQAEDEQSAQEDLGDQASRRS